MRAIGFLVAFLLFSVVPALAQGPAPDLAVAESALPLDPTVVARLERLALEYRAQNAEMRLMQRELMDKAREYEALLTEAAAAAKVDLKRYQADLPTKTWRRRP